MSHPSFVWLIGPSDHLERKSLPRFQMKENREKPDILYDREVWGGWALTDLLESLTKLSKVKKKTEKNVHCSIGK